MFYSFIVHSGIQSLSFFTESVTWLIFEFKDIKGLLPLPLSFIYKNPRISQFLGPTQFFYTLNCILLIISRFVVGWLIP